MFLWDVSTGRTIRKFRGHDGVVNSVRPLPCGCSVPSPLTWYLLWTGQAESLCQRYCQHRETKGSMLVLLHGGAVCCWNHDIDAAQLCMGPGEETLVTGGYDQAVRVWDMRSRSFDAIQTIKLFADSVTTVAVSTRCDACST